MKDLKHYFAENVKTCEASNNETKEVTKDPVNPKTSVEDAKEISSPATKRKRGRVKIKISQKNANERVCDIVDSKNDLIDKTPSPFTARNDGKNDESSKNETPKRSNSLPRKSTKNCLVEAAIRKNSTQSDGDENDNLLSNVDKKNNGTSKIITDSEESNAFRVLMTRKKPLQYAIPPPLTTEEEEATAKIVEESKIKLKQNKEKLIALADKKGYTKRKLGEIEEAEKIERRLEKRAKVFKANGKKESDEANSPVLERRVMPGSLHNYFSKTTPEQKETEITNVSTLVVKAEIHECNSVDLTKVREIADVGFLAKIAKAENREAMAAIDDIEIVGSENLGTEGNTGEKESNRSRKKKPRWSLRINLQCNDKDEPKDTAVQNEDKTQIGKRESKPRKSKVKTTNYEENEGSESDLSNPPIPKKTKSSVSKKSKIATSKTDIKSPVSPNTKTEDLQNEESDIVLVKVVKPQTNEKLAPLFVRKQKPDPAVMEARRLFLHSVPTENENQRTERKTPFVGMPLLPFPTISHVTQFSDESQIESLHSKYKFPIYENFYTPSYTLNDFKAVNCLNRETKNSQSSVEMTKENVEEVLKEIEGRCSDAREIWNRISTMNNGVKSKSPKRKLKKRKSSEKKMENSTEEKILHDGIWTQKYRPKNSSDIVGNEEAAKKLHAWLDGWKLPLRKENDSSGDEFDSSDCIYDNNQVAVLLGPHGSGKTASVYAVAEELGYSVIEVNASSKRGGKKLLKELEEATKSHRIKKSEGQSLLPIPKEKKALPQNSLILVEDVDLIFEEDEGFITATFQLASNTKRPIVMTGRDTCSHLNRMAPQQLRIYYNSTFGSRVSALLELITLAESGYRLPRPCLDRLLQNGDLRKALLQLQYLLLSGTPKASEIPTNFHRSLWQDMRYCLYKPAIKATKKPSKKKLTNAEKSSPFSDEKEVVTSLAKDLDNISFLSTFIEIDDPALDIASLKLEPSMSLIENTHSYSISNSTSIELTKWLKDRVMKTAEDAENDLQITRQLSLKKELNVGVNLALSQVSPHTLDGRAIALDYLPSVRNICRAEEIRFSTSNKRGNRFFHYLQNLRLPSTSTRPNILAAACKIMRDKNSDS